jgi:type II secretion system protein N
VLTVASLALFIVCVYLFIPSRLINSVIDQTLAPQGLSLTPAAHKSFLPGLVWDNAQLSSPQGALLLFDTLEVRPQLLQLCTGRIILNTTATRGAGRLNVNSRITGRRQVTLATDRLELSQVPFFKTVLGASFGGRLWSEGAVIQGKNGWNGELKLEISQLAFSGIRMGAFALPDADNLTSQGMIRVTDGKARLESLTLQGEGVYMRLSGNIPTGVNADSSPLDLVLEIMPKPEFLEKQKLAFLLLAKFMTSPGVYRVPIKGTLLKPEIL